MQQLRAYLSFFDQLLANAFAQLGATNTQFGLEPKNLLDPKTYFSQSLVGETPGIESLIDPILYDELLQNSGVSPEENQQRQKRLTQHLLARFSEQITDFSHQDFIKENETQWDFLRRYPHISYRRFTAMDYTKNHIRNTTVSGLEERLNYYLGFPTVRPVKLAKLTADQPGAFYLVEHLLLRPIEEDDNQDGALLYFPLAGSIQTIKDPYSLQLSFIFPNWLTRFDDQFWQFIAKTVREQTPAHLKIYIHRFNKLQMTEFEAANWDWFNQLKKESK